MVDTHGIDPDDGLLAVGLAAGDSKRPRDVSEPKTDSHLDVWDMTNLLHNPRHKIAPDMKVHCRGLCGKYRILSDGDMTFVYGS